MLFYINFLNILFHSHSSRPVKYLKKWIFPDISREVLVRSFVIRKSLFIRRRKQYRRSCRMNTMNCVTNFSSMLNGYKNKRYIRCWKSAMQIKLQCLLMHQKPQVFIPLNIEAIRWMIRKQCIVMLAIRADRRKLMPYVIFKCWTIPKSFPCGIILRLQARGRMMADLMKDWINVVYDRLGALCPRSMLVLDSFRGLK